MYMNEMADLRYEETVAAITTWLAAGQEGKRSPADALDIAKAFLSHAAMGIAMSLPRGTSADGQLLLTRFREVVLQFIDEKERDVARGK